LGYIRAQCFPLISFWNNMMRRLTTLLAVVLVCASLAAAQDAAPQKKWKRVIFRISQMALAAGNGADAFSSWGRNEINPVFGRGQFGGQQLALKTAIAGGTMLAQEFIARKVPAAKPVLSIANFGMAGYLGWQAKQNFGFPKIGDVAAPAAVQSTNSTR
jgi:hypothetical protein